MTQPRYRAVVVVGLTRDGHCGHCGSYDLSYGEFGHWCSACRHWASYTGPPPAAKTAEEIASAFRGSR